MENIIDGGCDTCGHYYLKKMVTSGKPYGYSGDIACFRCVRFNMPQDLHTNKGVMDGKCKHGLENNYGCNQSCWT